ncbi:RusA family crossover junction endodeoxyribonuclease [Alkalihalobacillus trypoxylicola]|uniref:Holliday junction resolvase n=1 Tax=Alkalihalobacillus trypoxylicola TaxID=519424 RepID=A0A161PAA4_9BACI|nr:RusA family crossover junction endodeoxyribonuclease [Alkalihalobacillus trypoxylicola]KYG28161.1 hypothetical protein AZF04_09665 [Alkalihalobacillus trypoxylicola]
MTTIGFVIDGEAVAQGRPRFGKGRAYDPTKSRDYKQYVRLVASQHKPAKPFEGQIALKVRVYKPIPKSMSKKLREEAIKGTIQPVTRPDVDNYVKGIKDGMNSVIWNDDSQVVELTVSKWYSENPRVEVEVTEKG